MKKAVRAKGAPKRGDYRSQLRQKSLLESAALVFAEKGYDRATMTEIAARSDSAIGSLYLYFPTKEALASALTSRIVDKMVDRIHDTRLDRDEMTVEQMADTLFNLLSYLHEEYPALDALSECPVRDCKQWKERIISALRDLLATTAPGKPADELRQIAAMILMLSKTARNISQDFEDEDREPLIERTRLLMRGFLAGELG